MFWISWFPPTNPFVNGTRICRNMMNYEINILFKNSYIILKIQSIFGKIWKKLEINGKILYF